MNITHLLLTYMFCLARFIVNITNTNMTITELYKAFFVMQVI